MHTLSKKLSGFSISIKHDKSNEYGNVDPSFNPDYSFRIGMERYPIDFDLLNTLQQNLSQSFIYTNQIKDEFRIIFSICRKF